MTRLEIAVAAAHLLSTAVVAGSAVLAVIAYLDDIETQKSEFTFRTAEAYHDTHLVEARATLFDVIAAEQRQVAPGRLGARDLNTLLTKKLLADPPLDPPVQRALVNVAGFFNSAVDCVDSRLCDGALMQSLLGAEATQFGCVFSGVLDGVAAGSNVDDLIAGTRRLANGGCE